MGFRFRRSIRLAPGLRINLSRSGVSTTVGPRSAHVTVGRRGVTETVGVPGTGISYSTTHRRSVRPVHVAGGLFWIIVLVLFLLLRH